MLFGDSLIRKGGIDRNTWILFILMIFSLCVPLITVAIAEGANSMPIWVHEGERILFNIALLVCVSRYRISFKLIYWIGIIFLLINTTIQILQYAGVSEITDFIEDNYLEGEASRHLDLARKEGFGFRSGSIFVNPNVYMIVPLSVLCMILYADTKKPSVLNLVWMALCVASLLFTGSRTTLFVAAALVLIYLFYSRSSNFWLIFVLIALTLYVIVRWDYLTETYRVFAIDEGMDDSFGVKMSGFIAYLEHANPVYFLTGSMTTATQIAFDSEWLYTFAYYGVAGLAWYVTLYYRIYKARRNALYYALLLMAVQCLVAVSASVFMVMCLYPFFAIIAYAEYE